MNKIYYKTLLVLFSTILLAGCKQTQEKTQKSLLSGVPNIEGTKEYLDSPFVTAGDRVYMVGHQNGSFPELGWHIKGEMGGIWNHPIKLLDGFDIQLMAGTNEIKLDNAHSFRNYPFANMHFYTWEGKNIEIERHQFVPDGKEGVLVKLKINNQSDTVQQVDLSLNAHTDLLPTWLGERTGMYDGIDQARYDENNNVWIVKDSINPWFTVVGTDLNPSETFKDQSVYKGNGVTVSSRFKLTLPKGVTDIKLVIAGSLNSEEEALATYQDIMANWKSQLKSKQDRYAQLASQSKLTTPDAQLNETFQWLKYNCDWLVRTVPGIGSGIGAGIPDYPWWFGVDSEYALQGYMAIGQKEVVYNTIALLDSVSNAVNGNGRIIHEMSTNGAIFNPGNINETPQFATLIWKIYQWNGDKAFLQKYFPTIEKGLEWLMVENDKDGNGFPDGFGMMEIHGLDSEMIDVAAYTQKSFLDASKIASVLGFRGKAIAYAERAEEMAQKINEEFWSEQFNSYADFIGTDQQALHLIEDAIVRADTLGKPWAVEELKSTKAAILANPSNKPRPFVLHHNWVVNTPMEVGIADPEKALKALNTAEKFVNPFGVFVTGIDRDESAGSDDGSFKGSKVFSYTGAVMTLPTGVQVVAENNYGRPDKALNYLERMTRTFSYALPGSMYEVSPDYGMHTQAWNIYSFAVPIVEQFFGIQPNAGTNSITIKPQMPKAWNKASLENVAIGDNEISVYYEMVDGVHQWRVSQQKDWDITMVLPSANTEVKISEGVTKSTSNAMDSFVSSEKSIEISSRYEN